jgi:hypothetical protein
MKMKVKVQLLFLLTLIFTTLIACSSEPPIDPELIEGTLVTNPAQLTTGKSTEFIVSFTGATFADDVKVTVDIRFNDEMKTIDATMLENGTFSAYYVFTEKGFYDIYLHLYSDDLHVTKKKQVEVQ